MIREHFIEVLQLQHRWSDEATAAMQQRGVLIRDVLPELFFGGPAVGELPRILLHRSAHPRRGRPSAYSEAPVALNFDSSPRWKTILPPIRSPFRNAQPRPEQGSISSLPSKVNTTAGLSFLSVS